MQHTMVGSDTEEWTMDVGTEEWTMDVGTESSTAEFCTGTKVQASSGLQLLFGVVRVLGTYISRC